MGYTALVKPLDSLCKCCRADGQCKMVQMPGILRWPLFFGGSFFVGKHRDQASITRIKIHMAFIWIIQIGLVKNERHAQNPLPKINRCLAVSTNDGDMMHALRLNFSHCLLS